MPLAHNLNLQTSPFSNDVTIVDEVLHAVLLNQTQALGRNLIVLSLCLSEKTKESMICQRDRAKWGFVIRWQLTDLGLDWITQTPAGLCFRPHIKAPVTIREHSKTPEELQMEHYTIKITGRLTMYISHKTSLFFIALFNAFTFVFLTQLPLNIT